ncbi:hypothetical protein I6F30_11215 [Bradyrhizobium sp. NBAIM20]|uniref:hypothetical protein n=1 Tax=unclassified Bradyrhizobium TaxID=2631580 RepID=UPI001CD73559|nr:MULTISPECIES: hypothetical protein [unclassified Bradyrhizobium]MCA1411705.1 hypothetical protein [Bradyrhizobium sp. NBAIM20]MCA1460960.1 hypothetical protein [Bradyrhizobium sp. NBAIM18]
MADDGISSTISQHEARRPKTGAERQRAYRERKRQQRQIGLAPALPVMHNDASNATTVAPPVTPNVTLTHDTPVALPVTPVTLAVTLPFTANVTESHRQVTRGRSISSYGLTAAALALAGVGLTMNGWFAHTLGSTDLAGWLFLAIGVASDLVALAVPPTAIQLWQARRRATATVAWLVWSMTFVFAVTSGIGFASVNIADVTLARASRVTPAVTMARDALRDAVTSRNRECAGGVGRFCREREQAVTDRQRALESVLSSVERAADPQTDAAAKIVAWLTAGTAKPGADGFAMLRLMLLALLPQIGGILLMIGRAR